MNLSIFHINEDLTFYDFQKIVDRPFQRAIRCRHKTFFAVPFALSGTFLCNVRGNSLAEGVIIHTVKGQGHFLIPL